MAEGEENISPAPWPRLAFRSRESRTNRRRRQRRRRRSYKVIAMPSLLWKEQLRRFPLVFPISTKTKGSCASSSARTEPNYLPAAQSLYSFHWFSKNYDQCSIVFMLLALHSDGGGGGFSTMLTSTTARAEKHFKLAHMLLPP